MKSLTLMIQYLLISLLMAASFLTFFNCGDDWPTSFECDEGYVLWEEDDGRKECLRDERYCEKIADKCIEACPADPASTYCPTSCDEYAGIALDEEKPATSTGSMSSYLFCCDYFFMRQNCDDCSKCGDADTAALNPLCLMECAAECDTLTTNQAKIEICKSDCLMKRMVCMYERVYTDSNYIAVSPASYTAIAGVPIDDASDSTKFDAGADDDDDDDDNNDSGDDDDDSATD